MGILFSIPLAGTLGTIATSCIGGLAFCCTSTAGQFVALRRMVTLTESRGSIASMFCKSCNCNSSIATRIGFAASPRNISPCTQSNNLGLDRIHTQFPFGMAHEDTVRHTQNRGMELRLHQDGLRRRQVLRCTRGASCLSSPLLILSSYFL